MNKHLVWVNFGGENGSPERMQGYYKVCTGETEDEIVRDWAKQNEFDMKDISHNGQYWTDCGRKINLFELIENNGYSNWKGLQWI